MKLLKDIIQEKAKDQAEYDSHQQIWNSLLFRVQNKVWSQIIYAIQWRVHDKTNHPE